MLYIRAIWYAFIFNIYETRRRLSEWAVAHWVAFNLWAEEKVAFHDQGAEGLKALYEKWREIGDQDGNELQPVSDRDIEGTAVGGEQESAEYTEPIR